MRKRRAEERRTAGKPPAIAFDVARFADRGSMGRFAREPLLRGQSFRDRSGASERPYARATGSSLISRGTPNGPPRRGIAWNRSRAAFTQTLWSNRVNRLPDRSAGRTGALPRAQSDGSPRLLSFSTAVPAHPTEYDEVHRGNCAGGPPRLRPDRLKADPQEPPVDDPSTPAPMQGRHRPR